ncbi:MAG: DUF2807 domain-containing protein [Clostridiales bacterium]|nr:DUF2807 domain-containing protein [Clostridiales bacterium]
MEHEQLGQEEKLPKKKKIKSIVILSGVMACVFAASIFAASIVWSMFSVQGNGSLGMTEYVGLSDSVNLEIDQINANNIKVTVNKLLRNKIAIRSDKNILEHLSVEILEDNIVIKDERGGVIEPTVFEILIGSQISQLTISGMYTADINNITDGGDFSMYLTGAGNVNIDGADIGRLATVISGAVNVKLAGSADFVEYDANGACTIDAFSLVAEEANVRASGASEIKVFANEKIKVNSTGASTIIYDGTATVTGDTLNSSMLKKRQK